MISRDKAEQLLQPRSNGLFLVRESTNFPGDYTLCVCYQNKVEHYRVKYHDRKLTIDDEEFFDNLALLVEVHLYICYQYQYECVHFCIFSALSTRCGRALHATSAMVTKRDKTTFRTLEDWTRIRSKFNNILKTKCYVKCCWVFLFLDLPSRRNLIASWESFRRMHDTRRGIRCKYYGYIIMNYTKWNIIEQSQIREQLGKGEFGEVSLGMWKNKRVAVKMLKDSGEAMQKFLEEAQLMKYVQMKCIAF